MKTTLLKKYMAKYDMKYCTIKADFLSATNQGKPVLRFGASPDFLVVFKGCRGWAVECRIGARAEIGSLSPGILQSC